MWWFAAAVAYGAQCETIGMADVKSVTPPAVVVLGDRHGMYPDQGRATKIVRALAARAPTVLATDILPPDRQPALDKFNAGEILVDDLGAALEWEQASQWPYEAWTRLFDAAWFEGVPVVAAGVPMEPAPEDAEFPVPGGYMSVLDDALGEGEMPLAAQSHFVRQVAWRDYQIASQALSAWNGEGYLVVLADRLHVEGGKGVSWQAGLITRVPVHAFVLAWANDPPCFAGDKIWAPGLSEKLSGAQKPPPAE